MNNTIASRLHRIEQEIRLCEERHGRRPHTVALLAVSKTKPVSAIREAITAGQRRFGENYLQEALQKIEALRGNGLEWHFIGPLQSNKSRDVASHFDWVHAVDRLKIAQRLNDQRPDELPPLNVCLQINSSGEASKSGIGAEAAAELAAEVAALPRLKLRGLMTIPAPEHDFERQRHPFRLLRETLARLNESGYGLDTLSMGMSDDMEAAIAEGATLVRIGTALFGARG